ncbi:ABC transporter permease [Limibacterium fermenti]|uniref:ABC transporter permease n=1 Tax=Limibacterium fermenti TaxID=3229863 RepID=UPI000E85B53F|nr:ABC transporter permease [Porphyromonadaceae bacterium]
MLLRTAIKNILGAGRRTWLNVAVLSFVFVLMVAYNGILDGFMKNAVTSAREWDAAYGQLWSEHYDPYDIFTLQDAHEPIPEELNRAITAQSITPVLLSQATAYQGGNMQNILLRGIDPEQHILKIPSKELASDETGAIKAVIGKRMANTLKAAPGDNLLIRWRDKYGAFDAREIVIASIFDSNTATIDAGQIWISLDNLRQMTQMQGEATYFVLSKESSIRQNIGTWVYKDTDFLLNDLYLMEQSNRVESVIIFSILLAVALLAVFDTQTLSIFRRQKEIGTYVALGMTPKRVTRLFTLEGTSYSILAILISFIWGTPVLYWFAKTGLKLPEGYAEMGLGMGDAMYPVYQPSSILTSIILIVVLSMLISYIPSRKIAKSNIVEALKGRIN